MRVHEQIALVLLLLRVICAQRGTTQATAGLMCYSGIVEMDTTIAKDTEIPCDFPNKFCQITERVDRDGKMYTIRKGCSATQCTKKIDEADGITRYSRCCQEPLCNAELKPRSTSITSQRSVTQEASVTPRMSATQPNSTQPSSTQPSSTQPPGPRTNAASLGTRGMPWLYCMIIGLTILTTFKC